MSGKFVFEIAFIAKPNITHKENITFITEEESMINYEMLRKSLRNYVPEPFRLKYTDEEDDIVPIDTEDEFKEFLKFAQQRSSKCLSIKLIVDESHPESEAGATLDLNKDESTNVVKMKNQIKEELKKELLLEIEMYANELNVEEAKDYGQDFYGNVMASCEKRRKKLLNKQMKIERKDKHDESKFDKRLEKLEAKKNRLLEKAEQRRKITPIKKPALNSRLEPRILSAVTTNGSSVLLDTVHAGATFYHTWHITNDGTLPLDSVVLRHYWSTPGLEPWKLSTKCPALAPGKEGIIPMGFLAPDEEVDFVSYWHFFHELNEKCVKFGHYVELRGRVKAIQKSSAENVSGDEKMLNNDKKSVTFADKAETKTHSQMKDTFRLPCQMQIEVQKMLDATLVSSKIAAEMAKEAADVAYRRAKECSCSQSFNATAVGTPTTTIVDVNKTLEKAAESIQKLNMNSCSDPDTNVDSSEDTDRGFVLVDVPSCYLDNGPGISEKASVNKDKNIDVAKVDNNMMVMPEEKKNAGGKENIKDEKKQEELNESNKCSSTTLKSENVDNFKYPAEQFSVSGINQPHITYPSHIHRIDSSSCNAPRVNPYIPPISSQQPMVYHPLYVTPNILPNKVNVYNDHVSDPAYTRSGYVPYVAPSKPGPFTFAGQSPINSPMLYQNIHPVGPYHTSTAYNVASMSNFRNTCSNSVGNRLPEWKSGISNVSKNQAPQIVSTKAGNQLPYSSTATTKVSDPTSPDLLNTTINAGMLPTPLAPSQMNATPLLSFPHMYPALNTLNNIPHGNFNTQLNNPQGVPEGTFKQASNNTLNSDVVHKPMESQIDKPLPSSECVYNSNIQGQTSVNDQIGFNPAKTVGKESGIQILPQSLVDGAINVASSAYSTACNAISNLRPKGASVDFDPVFETSMARLVEMGLNNLELNARLLKRFNNDVNQVTEEIFASSGGDLLLD